MLWAWSPVMATSRPPSKSTGTARGLLCWRPSAPGWASRDMCGPAPTSSDALLLTAGGVPLKNPSTSPADIKTQMAYNNIILWQAGIQMAADTDTTCYNGAVWKDEGIFEVSQPQNYTFNVPDDPQIVAPLLNARDRVFNVAYLHSVAGLTNSQRDGNRPAHLSSRGYDATGRCPQAAVMGRANRRISR